MKIDDNLGAANAGSKLNVLSSDSESQHRGKRAMFHAAMAYVRSFFPTVAGGSKDLVFESQRAAEDIALNADPSDPFWQSAPAVCAERDSDGVPMPQFHAEIRSRWTERNLYFLFVCPFEELSLNPSPCTASETFRLWDWDVAEVFIGSDFRNIQRYKEFEISPQGEFVDLDVDLTKPDHENGWTWSSGFSVAARIDSAIKVWHGAMSIPFTALDRPSPVAGETFRINLFWSQQRGAKVAWQPTMSHTFHVPERFGLLRLVGNAGHGAELEQ
jgi:hypothetical protein